MLVTAQERIKGSVQDMGRRAIVAIAVAAFVLRAVALLQDGGTGPILQDDEVYFSAAGLFAGGQAPYADFVLLHPPGIVLLLAPIAALGDHLIGYMDAFVAARWLGTLIGAVNTALVGFLALRWRGPAAGVAAAALYAVFPPAIGYERLILLDPIVSLLVLVALMRWVSREAETRTGTDIAVTGSLIGLAAAVKLTGGVILLACLLIGPFTRVVRDRALLIASMVAAFSVVVVPFALSAGVDDFVRQVLVYQMERPSAAGEPSGQIDGIASRGLHMLAFLPNPEEHLPEAAGLLLLALGLAVSVWAWVRGGPTGRLLALAWGASAVLLLTTPKFYEHYPLLIAPLTCLLLGAALQAAYSSLSRRSLPARGLAVVTLVAVAAVGVATALDQESRYPLREYLEAEVPDDACIYADPPSMAFTMDRLPVLADPWGDPLYPAVSEGGFTTERDAGLSAPAQRRLREGYSSCDYVLMLQSVPTEHHWSSATRASFYESHELVSRSSELVELWRRTGRSRGIQAGTAPR